jgi:GDPmannose 4,6-dehydratase
MLQQQEPEDYVIGTGEQHTVREFCELAFNEAGITIKWEGEGKAEKGIDEKTGKTLIQIDPNYYRLAEVETLLGNPAKAKQNLGWNPNKTSFKQLVEIMMAHDLKYVLKQNM